MTRTSVLTLLALLLLGGLLASVLSTARAANDDQTAMTDGHRAATIERCILEPHTVTHPENGVRILVLRSSC